MKYVAFILAMLSVYAVKAEDYSQEYYDCLETSSKETENDYIDIIRCTKQENLRQQAKIEAYTQQLLTYNDFNQGHQKNTIPEQNKNMADYAKSYCQYHAQSRHCLGKVGQAYAYEECIASYTKLTAEGLNDLLQGLQKQYAKKMRGHNF